MDIGKNKILFMTARFPYPLIGGDRLKPYKLLEFLGARREVTLITYDVGNTEGQAGIDAIKDLGIKLIVIPMNRPMAGLKSMLKFFGSNPAEIDYYQSSEYAKAVRREIATGSYDMIMSFFMRTGEYAKNIPIKKILIAEDCRTLYQKRSSAEATNLVQRFVRYYEYKRLSKYEPKLMRKFDAVTLVTQEDIKACKRLSTEPDYYVLTNGTDIHKYTMPIDNEKRKDIIFTGRLDVEANRIMLHKICKDLMPAILKQVPTVQLHVAGAFPSADIERLIAKNDNFHLYENVPDMVPYLQTSRVYLHPHRGGSGIQNKLLEAMACGCPVVTSPTGNQGINAKDGFEAFVCESDNEFIRATVRLLKEDALVRKLSLNGRLLIKQTHSWETVYEQLKHVMARVFPQ